MKAETYTVIDCREFDALVETHLGVKRRCVDGCVMPDGEYEGIQQDFMCGQDTYIIVGNDPKEWDEWEHNWKGWEQHCEAEGKPYDQRGGIGALSMKYASDLFRMGVFPPEHPLFIQVWW